MSVHLFSPVSLFLSFSFLSLFSLSLSLFLSLPLSLVLSFSLSHYLSLSLSLSLSLLSLTITPSPQPRCCILFKILLELIHFKAVETTDKVLEIEHLLCKEDFLNTLSSKSTDRGVSFHFGIKKITIFFLSFFVCYFFCASQTSK